MRVLVTLLLVGALFSGGCAGIKNPTATDKQSIRVVLDTYPYATPVVAQRAAQWIAKNYKPAETTFFVDAEDSPFRDELISLLKRDNFTISENPEFGLKLNYVLEVVKELNSTPKLDLHMWIADGSQYTQSFDVKNELTIAHNPSVIKEGVDVAPSEDAPAEEWAIEPGSLRAQLQLWTNIAGYQLVWKASNDYMMESAASFHEPFLSALQTVISRMHMAGNPLRVTVYNANKVISITED